MKIKYEFVTGEVVEIEVDEEWGKIVKDLDRIEHNNNVKETRRHISLELIGENREMLVEDVDSEEAVIDLINLHNYEKILSTLEEEKQNLLRALYEEGLSQEEYAERIGVSQVAVSKQLRKIRNEIKRYFF